MKNLKGCRISIIRTAILICLMAYSFSTYASTLPPLLVEGAKAPSFTLKCPGGKDLTYGTGGKRSVLIFWSAFCPVCGELMGDLNEVYKRYGANIDFVSVNVDGRRYSHAIINFISRNHIRFPVVYDRIVNDLFVASDNYGVRKTPTIFFIDRQGIIITVLEGYEGKKIQKVLLTGNTSD